MFSNNDKNTSLVKVLLIFYLLSVSNYTHNLLSKQIKEFIESNRIVQHIISLLTMIVLLSTVGGFSDNRKILIYSIFAYIWFIFSTKLDIQWNIAIITILFIGYMYENEIDNYCNELHTDKNVTYYIKKNIDNKNKTSKLLIIITVIIITIIGTTIYSNRKEVQYGGDYDPLIYFLY